MIVQHLHLKLTEFLFRNTLYSCVNSGICSMSSFLRNLIGHFRAPLILKMFTLGKWVTWKAQPGKNGWHQQCISNEQLCNFLVQ